MILLFPIENYERDILREMTDHELVTMAEKDELVLTYPSTDEFLEALDNQEIYPQGFWHREVDKVYVVVYSVLFGGKKYAIVCKTKEEVRLAATLLRLPDPMVMECYDGSFESFLSEDTAVITLATWLDTIITQNPPITQPAIFSVTFTYDTPLTGKRHYVVECDTNEEAQKIAHDANTVDGIKYVHTYPVKRPTGTNGVRMTAEEYWKMYGGN